MTTIEDFVTSVNQECIVKPSNFNFFYLPEHVARKNYSRAVYDGIILKILLKVKALAVQYKYDKQSETVKTPKEAISITDDDNLPLDLFNTVVSQIKNKQSEQTRTINEFITECQKVVKDTKDKVEGTEKIKKTIEQNVLAEFLNKSMEVKNVDYMTNNYMHRNLFMIFIKQQSGGSNYRTARDFEKAFNDVFLVKQSTNKFNADYKRKLEIEMSKFSGKLSAEEGLETASEVTSATRLSKKDGGKKTKSIASRSSSPEKVLSEIPGGDPMGTIDRSEMAFDPHPE